MSWFTEYKKSLKMAEVEEMIDLIFYRHLAFVLVKLVYNTGIKPDHLTLAAIIAGLTGGLFYAFGLQLTCYIGAFFYVLFIILDCSDGQLARLKKNGSSIGRLLDGIADYIVVTSIYIGITIGYSQKEGQPSSMLLLLLISGISIIIQEVLVDFYRTRFLDIIMKRKNTFEEGIKDYRNEYIRLKKSKGKWLEKKIIYIYLVYSKLQRNLTFRKNRVKFSNVSSEEYYKKNRLLVRFWIFMGPSAMRTTLILCSLFNRYDIYFWITIGAFNLLAALIWIIQRYIDKSLESTNVYAEKVA
jgi:phosphatidylglycerophosphate synthase